MQHIVFYSVAVVLLLLSFVKDRQKTKKSLQKALKSFTTILPQMLGMIVSIGVILAWLNPKVISDILGNTSGWLGVITAAVIGSVTLIPAFVAFPMAAILLEHGAGYMQLSAFVSTLTMVGVLTFGLEKKYFGLKFTVWRNSLAFVSAFVVAAVISKVVG
ncbi:MAG: permease [Sphaerochaetaceae bacterium]